MLVRECHAFTSFSYYRLVFMKSGKVIPKNIDAAWRRHERQWKDNRYVYPVVSRRSRGISLGINLNPGKECNFDCIYCQVNRSIRPAVGNVDLTKLAAELDQLLQVEKEGLLYAEAPFSILPSSERGVRDIAFSGDGEPTMFPHLEEAVRIAARARQCFGLESAKIVLLTNAAYLTEPAVRSALAVMDDNNGEIWAKLDAGTEEYFSLVNRSKLTLQKILDNILDAAQIRPVVIQSLWFRLNGMPPPPKEIESYCDRLNSLLATGGLLKALQLYTIARDPAESFTSALSNEELDDLACRIRARVPTPIEIYYGVSPNWL